MLALFFEEVLVTGMQFESCQQKVFKKQATFKEECPDMIKV
jgi:hypothetical protein